MSTMDKIEGQRLRLAVISLLGGECVCCGYSDPRALQIHDTERAWNWTPPTNEQLRGHTRAWQRWLLQRPPKIRRSGNTRWYYGKLYAEIRSGRKAGYELRCVKSPSLSVPRVLPHARAGQDDQYSSLA